MLWKDLKNVINGQIIVRDDSKGDFVQLFNGEYDDTLEAFDEFVAKTDYDEYYVDVVFNIPRSKYNTIHVTLKKEVD